jgi:multiple sugar transport system substrate-binding protein
MCYTQFEFDIDLHTLGNLRDISMPNKPTRSVFQAKMDEMVNTLRDQMLNGELKKGGFVPSELELAKQFNLSKKSVRKGLDILLQEGRLEKLPRMGSRVKEPDSSGIIHLKLGCYPSVEEEACLRELFELFHTRHPQMRVSIVTMPYENFSPKAQFYLREGLIDALTINGWNFMEMRKNGALDLLEPIAPHPDHYPFLIRGFSHKGELRIQPFIFSPVVLCYNKDHLRKFRLHEPDSSWTWDQLSEVSRHIAKQHGIHGFYSHISSINRFPIFLLQNGVRFAANASASLEDPKLWEGLNTCRSLIYDQGMNSTFLSEKDSDTEAFFLQQKTSMIMATYFSMRNLRHADFTFDIAPLPYLKEPGTLLLSTGLAVNRSSPHLKAAMTLVRFLTSEEAQSHIRSRTLTIPAHKPAAEQQGVRGRSPSRFLMYRDVVQTFHYFDDFIPDTRLLEILQSELKFYWGYLEDETEIVPRMRAKLALER